MLYTQEEVNDLLKTQTDKLLKEIVKNNSKCQKCSYFHQTFDCCFLAFGCVQTNFAAFKEK